MTNQEFNSLTKAEKRVFIAKDVIAEIGRNKFIPEFGRYFRSEYAFEFHEDIQKNFENMGDCNVCALGACMLSITKQNNKVMFGEVDYITDFVASATVKNNFLEIFTEKQLTLIEIAFEEPFDDESLYYGIQNFGKEIISEEEFKKSQEFCNVSNTYSQLEQAEIKLTAIMQNIIDNKGNFIP